MGDMNGAAAVSITVTLIGTTSEFEEAFPHHQL